jgi:hypothetical protein
MMMRSPSSASSVACRLSHTGCDRPRPSRRTCARLREQVRRSCGVGLHGLGDHLEAGGHVEVDRGRDLAQVAQRLADARGAWACRRRCRACRRCCSVMPKLWLLPKVWFQGSQSTSTGGASPAPAETGDLLQVGAPHALRVDHRLGQLGGAAGEEKLDDGVGPRGVHGRVDGGRGAVARRSSNEVAARPSMPALAHALSSTSSPWRTWRGRSVRRRWHRPGRA